MSEKVLFSFSDMSENSRTFLDGLEVLFVQNRVMGYARVSTREQNLDRQMLELKKYVPEEKMVYLLLR